MKGTFYAPTFYAQVHDFHCHLWKGVEGKSQIKILQMYLKTDLRYHDTQRIATNQIFQNVIFFMSLESGLGTSFLFLALDCLGPNSTLKSFECSRSLACYLQEIC